MRFLLGIFIVTVSLFGAKSVAVGERFQDSQKCKACHMHIVREWEESWHAKSHYKNDEYFNATINYVKRKTRKSLNSIKVQCATCHNPRISVTSTGMDYEIAAVMGLDKGSEVNKALQSDTISEGINCVVCHNIDKIHEDRDESYRGINRVEWTKSGIMSGPYEDSKSPYHKVEHRDFMDKNPNQLCLVCHANDKSVEGLMFTNMEDEYKSSDSKESCVDCHMGPKKMSVAATLRDEHGKQRKRKIRAHAFPGAHTKSMWRTALSLSLEQTGNDVVVTINNPLPHNIPSGFGARELIVELLYKANTKVMDTKSISLTNHYTSKRGKPTIPHLAVESSKDMSIPAMGKKVLKVQNVDGSDEVEVKLYYRLVNDEVNDLLKLKEKIWSEKNLITSKAIKLR